MSSTPGVLRLKGDTSKIAKPKKKKKPKTNSTPAIDTDHTSAAQPGNTTTTTTDSTIDNPQTSHRESNTEKEENIPTDPLQIKKGDENEVEEEEEEEELQSHKTQSELRHEEHKKRRLHDRLKREGRGKTHKERVEELNRYLSGLSEHHDMPRIGPG